MTVKGAYSIRGENQKPVEPSIKFENDTKITQYLNGMEIAFDPYFTLYGTVEVYADGEKILDENEIDAFRQYGLYTIPINSKTIRPYSTVEVYVWNPVTDDIVFLSAGVDLDDTAHPSTLSGQAVNNEILLNQIGGGAGDEYDTHDIFPYQIYRNETKEFLINTKGRQNMLLTMAASNVLPPEIIQDNFVPDAKPDPIPFKINSDPDNTPDTQANVEGSYASAGTIRNPNHNAFRTPQTETEWYYVTEYLNILRDVTLADNTILDDVTFDKFVDEYLLIDGQGTEDKEIKFNFNSGSFSQDVTSGSMAFTRTRTIKYQRTRTVQFSGSFFSASNPVRKNEITPWTAYAPVSTSYGYSSATVMLRCNITFEIEVSDDINFASFRKIKDISTNGTITVNFSEKYMRIKRIVTGERLIVNYGSSGGSSSVDLSYPDITSDYTVTNLIDLQSHGGTAKLSFWLKGVNEQWFELLKSDELGAITQGDSKLIQYKIEGIPPSQSRFKAMLQVTGSLKTGVTIDLVA